MFILLCPLQSVQLVLFIPVSQSCWKGFQEVRSQVPPRPGVWKGLWEGSHSDHYFHTAEVSRVLLGPWMLRHMQAGWTESSQRISLSDQVGPLCLLDGLNTLLQSLLKAP